MRDPVQDVFVNAATVRATMYESDGVTEVSGASWPLTLDYVAASDGVYQGVLEDGRVLVEGERYWMELTIDAGGDLIDVRRWADIARYRGPSD